jgi:hypothetical protein
MKKPSYNEASGGLEPREALNRRVRENVMNRLSFFACSAMLGLVFVSSSALAQQQQTLRQQLAGAWEVVSLGNPEGAVAKVVGTNPKGYLGLSGSGKFVFVLRNPNRAKNAGRADGMAAAFGSWSVNEADKTLTLHIDGAMDSSAEGTDAKSTISLNGDELRATGGNNFTNVYRRVRQAQ